MKPGTVALAVAHGTEASQACHALGKTEELIDEIGE